MTTLEELIQSGRPATPLQYRPNAYGPDGGREFLRDVLAMANAGVPGPRLIVVGVDSESAGSARLRGIGVDDFKRQPSFVELVRQHIEPPVAVKYLPVNVAGTQVGVVQIGDCQDRPYMMRTDHSPTLRRGDAWVRVNNEVFRMDRNQLQALFQANFKDAIGTERIEIGFAGEMNLQTMVLPVCDIQDLPSAVAANKVRQMLDVKEKSKGSGNTTLMARLTHARVFGAGSSYEEQSVATLAGELGEITQRHRLDDQRFLFETHGVDIQIRIFNQSESPIKEASFTLALPNVEQLYVAKKPGDERYPTVDNQKDATVVTNYIGEIPSGTPFSAFTVPLKICAGRSLQGQRLTVGYTLFGRNLRAPGRGQLCIDFRDQLEALMA
jgi:hypothetical protein